MTADRLKGADYEQKELVLNDARVEWLNKLEEAEQSASPVQQAISLAVLLAELGAVADPRIGAAVAIGKPILEQLWARATQRSSAPLDGDAIRDAYSRIRDLFSD